jgi:hypothetical protein
MASENDQYDQSRVEVWITEINLIKERDVCAKTIDLIKSYLYSINHSLSCRQELT